MLACVSYTAVSSRELSIYSAPMSPKHAFPLRRKPPVNTECKYLNAPALKHKRVPFRAGDKTLVTPQGRCGKSTCVAPEVFYDQVSFCSPTIGKSSTNGAAAHMCMYRKSRRVN